MCGLGAILRTDGDAIPETWLDAIDRRLAGRGPDGAGRFRDEGPGGTSVALVHRRLSIIDHAGGAQPMVLDRDGTRTAVVFNGCIYNHRELRRELAALGHLFHSDHSDTETLLHGYRAWGEELAGRLEGMYAWVIWDGARGSLRAARDWFGEKPLFEGAVRTNEGAVRVLASDARAVADVLELARAEGGARDGDEQRRAWLAQYLRFGYDLQETPYPDVRHVPIGLPERVEEGSDGPGDLSPTGIERKLDAAVGRRLEADVPLGCFLSGGVDSSLVAHFARRHANALRTFCVRMPDRRYDESMHAERVARHLGTVHTTLDVEIDPAGDLVRLVETMGRPFGDSSLLPTHWVSRAAREHVTVALSGDGGDELFYGYERYLAARLIASPSIGPLLRVLPPSLGAGAHPKGRRHKLGRLAGMARAYGQHGVLATELLFAPADLAALLPDAIRAAPAPREPAGDDGARALRDADLRRYLPGDLLAKVDSASMAVALEVRCPMLDRDLCRAVIPAARTTLMRAGRKGLLREIARRHLPDDVVDRPKMGFAIPVGEWFRDDYGGIRAMLADHLGSAEPFGSLPIEIAPARRLMAEHLEGRRDHGQRLFALLSLAIWSRHA